MERYNTKSCVILLALILFAHFTFGQNSSSTVDSSSTGSSSSTISSTAIDNSSTGSNSSTNSSSSTYSSTGSNSSSSTFSSTGSNSSSNSSSSTFSSTGSTVSSSSDSSSSLSSSAGSNITNITSSTGTNNSTSFNCADIPIQNISQLNDSYCKYVPKDVPVLFEDETPVSLCNISYYPGVYNKYDRTPVCLVIGGVAKSIFFTTVDDFSMMDLTPSALDSQKIRFSEVGLWIQVETGHIASKPKRRIVPGQEAYLVPFWTALIRLDKGYVKEITFDDGCYGCNGLQCIEDTCGVPITDCTLNNKNCGLRVYVGWSGTDGNGYYMTSAGKRLSRFRQYSLNYAYSSATDVGNTLVPGTPEFSGVDLGDNGVGTST